MKYSESKKIFHKKPSKAGLCANALVICVLLLNKGSLKAPPGIYVFHMSFADSMLLFSLPFAADNRLRGFKGCISTVEPPNSHTPNSHTFFDLTKM